MKLASDGKIDKDNIIFSDETITEVQGYKAMLYMLEAYWESTGSDDLTDILSGGKLWQDRIIDTAYWEYWLEAIIKVKNEGLGLHKI